MRELAKTCGRAVAFCAILPNLLSFRLRARLMGADRALEGSTQLLALVPGLAGQYVRRAFLSRVLKGGCHWTATIEFGTLFSQCGATIEENAYVGPRCHLGWVHIERNALVAAGVHIPSGGQTHGTADLDTPIRDQPHQRRLVRVGSGAWIGSAAVVMADVGADAIVAAGAVVTRPVPDRAIVGGVPARVIRLRDEASRTA
jgi:acetyltransferase-like isoleucine patch superfamily enzyme